MTKVAVGILQREGKILLCQRKQGSRYGLQWEFPGGKVEPDESILDCLKRELLEELSLHVFSVERVEIESAYYEDGGWFEVHYCYISSFDGTMLNHVFEDVRWVTPEELLLFDILKGNAPIIQRLRNEKR